MSEASKAARKAAADKVERLVGADPSGKPVDASSYTPPDALKTGVQTGMRPVSKRQFKKGGKVIGKMHGEKAHHHAGRKPRKAGGSAMPPVDRLVNRDMKKANEYRDGDKHIGGMKKGGRIHKDMGGMTPQAAGAMQDPRMIAAARMAASNRANVPQAMLQSMPTSSKISRGAGLKKGGHAHRSHKADGGVPVPPTMPDDIRALRNRSRAMVGDDITSSTGARPENRKHGGKANHPDVAEDKKLIKSMVKGAALKCSGGRMSRKEGGRSISIRDTWENQKGRDMDRAEQAMQPTMKNGGRMARKSGGPAGKGKMNVNVIVAPHAPQAGGMQPQGGMPPRPAGAVPVPMPPQGAGAPPMGRKAGGRTYRKEQDMDAGSGSGLGRLEKMQIQKHH